MQQCQQTAFNVDNERVGSVWMVWMMLCEKVDGAGYFYCGYRWRWIHISLVSKWRIRKLQELKHFCWKGWRWGGCECGCGCSNILNWVAFSGISWLSRGADKWNGWETIQLFSVFSELSFPFITGFCYDFIIINLLDSISFTLSFRMLCEPLRNSVHYKHLHEFIHFSFTTLKQLFCLPSRSFTIFSVLNHSEMSSQVLLETNNRL